MSQQLATTTDPIQVIASLPAPERNRAIGWANIGAKLWENEVTIANKVKTTIDAAPLPTDITQLAEYDKIRAALSKTANGIADERTSTDAWQKLEAYKKRRTATEGELKTHLAEYDAALLPLKQKQAAIDKAAQEKADALRRFRTSATIQYNEFVATCNNMVANKVAELFERAIKNPETKSIDGPTMDKMKALYNVASFPLPFDAATEPDEEKRAILIDVFSAHTPEQYVNAYHTALELKFIDFANANAHSVEALAQNSYETEQTVQQVQEQETMSNVGAMMAASVSSEVEVYHKPLKEVYEIDMPDNAATMVAIDSAFIALDGYNKMGRVKSLWNISMQQKAAFIAKCKCDDNALKVTGMVFKMVPKIA